MRILDGFFEKVNYQDNTSILLHSNKETDNYATHWHSAMEIIMPIDNIYTVIIGKKKYVLNEGDVLVIPAGELHEIIAPKTGLRKILLFDFSLISNLKGFFSISNIFNQTRYINEDNSPDILIPLQNLFDEINHEYNNNNTLREGAIYALLIQMFVLLGRKFMNTSNSFPDVKINKQKEYVAKFNLIFEYININYTEDITLDKIADVAGFSKFHFCRLFKQFTGSTFYDYLNQRRIKEAENLLLNPELTITDVAMHSGFSSISTFNRVFKSFKECTPTEFKKLYQENKIILEDYPQDKNHMLDSLSLF